MRPHPVLLLAALLGCATAPDGGGAGVDAPAFDAAVADSDPPDTDADTGDERLDMDADGYVEGDCAETDAAIHPGAAEVCNGLDDDCDGTIDADAADARTWFADADDDAYGDESRPVLACWQPADHSLLGGDCDDGDAAVYPAASEWCDGTDNNCSGSEDDATDAAAGYQDGDGDGFGFSPRRSCEPGPSFVAVDGDCDDGDAAIFPGGVEWCNGLDDDCDLDTDEDARDARLWYVDVDGDTLGDAALPAHACTVPAGHVADDADCDDAAAAIGGPIAWFSDDDGDGYGDLTTWACSAPAGSVALGGDCDDTELSVWPGAPEECDAASDLDCDGLVGTADGDGDLLRACDDCDDADATVAGPEAWYADRDGDGYGDTGQAIAACTAPTDFVADATDCNDASGVAWPGAPEVWYDDEDEDCLGGDDWDADLDGYAANVDDCEDTIGTVHPGVAEVCANHLDDDCDGTDGGCADVGTLSLAAADVAFASTEYAAHLGVALSAAPNQCGAGDSAILFGANGRDSGAGAVFVGSSADLLADGSAASWRATWEGVGVGDHAGCGISAPGDFDGDGLADVVVGAKNVGGLGAAYLIPLDATGVQSFASATQQFSGLSGGGQFGETLAAVPDLDGNGADELVIGDWYGDVGYGGTDRGCAYYYEGPLPSSSMAYTGRLCGDENEQFWMGSMAVVDVQGDGLPELVVSSSVALGHTNGSGKVAFVELPFAGVIEVDVADGFIYGTSKLNPIELVGGVGDVNGDGYEDLSTRHSADSTYAHQAGAARLYFGPLTSSVDDDDADMQVFGTLDDELAGIARGVGDLDGDGAADLMVEGSGTNDPSLMGRAGLFYGPMSSSDRTLDDADLLLTGENFGDGAGYAMLGPGDLNGDGFADLLVGAPFSGTDSEGRAYLWLGTGG